MRIVIGGDFAPTAANLELFSTGASETLYTNELIAYLNGFDFRIFDFECALEGKGEAIKKFGPLITAPVDAMPGILAIHPSLMVLANNHIGNLGVEGVKQTILQLEQEGISYVGAGINMEEAEKPYILEKEGLRIGIFACAEHEFTYASQNQGGANPYDPLITFEKIAELKEKCDYVFVFYHGGVIDHHYPTPREQRILRKMIDYGADLVIGQHTHCIGSSEIYKGKTIVYGQGDFLFARPTQNEYRYSGLLIEADVSSNGLTISYRVRIKPDNTIRLATKNEETEIIDAFMKRSIQLGEPGLLEKQLDKYIKRKSHAYLDAMVGKLSRNICFKIANKLLHRKLGGFIYKIRYRKKDLLRMLNYLECETHYEVFVALLKQKGNE